MNEKSITIRRSFSLIEMLVVIAIIVILSTLLLPVLSGVKAKGRYARWAAFMNGNRADSGLIVQYTFEEDSGASTVTNQSAGVDISNYRGATYDAILYPTSGATRLTVSKYGGRWPGKGCLVLNGADQYMEAKKAQFLQDWGDGAMACTVMYWEYQKSTDIQNGSIFDFGHQRWGTRLQAHSPWSNNNLYWDYGPCCGSPGRINVDVSAYYDKWIHVALVSKGIGGDFQGIYINGDLIQSAGSSTAPVNPDRGLFGLWVGGFQGCCLQKATIDEFQIYNRALSAAEIQRFYVMGEP